MSMPPAIRCPLLGIALLATTGGLCAAQHPHGLAHPAGHPSGGLGHYYQPFWGFGRHVAISAAPHPMPAPMAVHPHPSPVFVGFGLGGFGGGFVGTGFGFYGGPVFYGGSPFFAAPALLGPAQAGPGGLWLSQPTPTAALASTTRPAHTNPARSAELVELGDRAFRGGNFLKADERYHFAAKLDPEAPLPHVRLAQIALVRSNYSKAAGHLRDAVEAAGGSGWLMDAPDVQSLYGEPREFARRIAQLESHLQARPDDRDGWFVLGAQLFLSGHPREAGDAFARLADRPLDAAQSAFQDAATVSMRSLARGDANDRDDH